jgi:hypothetical protein
VSKARRLILTVSTESILQLTLSRRSEVDRAKWKLQALAPKNAHSVTFGSLPCHSSAFDSPSRLTPPLSFRVRTLFRVFVILLSRKHKRTRRTRYLHTHTHAQERTHAREHTPTHNVTHTRKHTHTKTHTHTHTHTGPLLWHRAETAAAARARPRNRRLARGPYTPHTAAATGLRCHRR